MDHKDFDDVVGNRVKESLALLLPKGEEYSRDGDRLHNFKRAAGVQGCSPEKALIGMYTKHLVSVLDMVDDIDKGKVPCGKVLAEKMNDSHNYHYLLEGLICERAADENGRYAECTCGQDNADKEETTRENADSNAVRAGIKIRP